MLVNLTTGAVTKPGKESHTPTLVGAMSPDGKRAVVGHSQNGEIRLWNLTKKKKE